MFYPSLRFQFSTKTLLAIITLACLALAYYASTPQDISFHHLEIDSAGMPAVRSVNDLPNSVMRWNSRYVRLRGYIHASSVMTADGIERFVLIRDNQMCSPGAGIDDWIYVTLKEGMTTNFSVRPITVTGRLSITDKHKKPDGSLIAIYEMCASEVSGG